MDTASLFYSDHAGCNQVEYFTDVKNDAQNRCPHHEVGKHCLLCWTRYVAVDQIRTWADVALDLPGQPKAVVDVVKRVEESDLECGLYEQTHQIRPPEAAVLLSRVVVKLCVLPMLGPVLAFPLFSVGHMQDHHE